VNYGRMLRAGDMSADAAIKAQEAPAKQRAERKRRLAIPHSAAKRAAAAKTAPGMNNIDLVQAVDYYTTLRE